MMDSPPSSTDPPSAGTSGDPSESLAVDKTVLYRVNAATSFVTRLGLTLALVIGYVLIAVASTSNEMLVMPDRTMTLPIFDTQVSVFGFFMVAPLLVVGLHGYFLTERLRLAIGLRELWPPDRSEKALDQGKASPVFVPAFLFRDPLLKWKFKSLNLLFDVGFLVLTLIPLAVLLFIQWTYLPSHALFESMFHRILVSVDLVLVSGAYLLTYYRVRKEGDEEGLYQRAVVAACGSAALLILSWFILGSPPVVPRWADLDLARFEPILSNPGLARVRFRLEDLADADLHEAQLEGVDLSECVLSRADLSGAVLRGTDLRKAHLDGADLSGADLTGAILTDADLRRARATEAKFAGAQLDRADLGGLVAHGADFFAADLTNARLTAADLYDADLRLADLRGGWLRGTRLIRAHLDGARFGSPPALTLGLDLRAADVRWVDELPRKLINLRLARLGGTSLRAQVLRWTALAGASDTLQPEEFKTARDAMQARLDVLKSAVNERLAGRPPLLSTKLRGRAEARLAELGEIESSPMVAVLQQTESSLFPDEVAKRLVPAACSQELLADFVIDKAAGDFLPSDPLAELALARRLLDENRQPCPELDRRKNEMKTRICARPDAGRRLQDLCPMNR